MTTVFGLYPLMSRGLEYGDANADRPPGGAIRQPSIGARAHALTCLAMAAAVWLLADPPHVTAKTLNGFDLDNASVPQRLIKRGGPDRDGIPSIDRPRFEEADQAAFLDPDDRVLGIHLDGESKAYPIKILDRHEVVNDRIAGRPVAVTYCPLCGSGIVFDANIDGPTTFGVSGLLYNSDVLLYDRKTESLWSQIAMEAIAGPLKGTQLEPLPSALTTWQSWKKDYPTTLVLSNRTGIYPPAAYENKAYADYRESNRLWFPVRQKDKRLPPKEEVLGILVDGQAKAYPLKRLAQAPKPVRDKVAGKSLRIRYHEKANSAQALDPDGKPIPAFQMYWFAWYAFYPDTKLYQPPAEPTPSAPQP